VAGKVAPTRTTDNFIYQALVGLWPVGAKVRATDDDRWLIELRQRLTAYVGKAVREAKVSTSWIDPDVQYEKAIEHYLGGMLDRAGNAPFLHDVEQFVSALAPKGRWNALARLVVHLTAPGIPDVYQGDELWFHALVDPDNRRPVDWAAREHALDSLHDTLPAGAELDAARLHAWCTAPEDGRLKLYLTSRLLRMRREHATMMTHGTYEPLVAEGEHAERVLSFRREHRGEARIVVVPRITSGLEAAVPIGAVWRDTRLRLPAADGGRVWRCQLGGQVVHSLQGMLALSQVLARLPVAVLAS
jgi:(1->4)-alpha-D-glucan 1-alpha-D-glucosylmutase